jgi:hypothetical protein
MKFSTRYPELSEGQVRQLYRELLELVGTNEPQCECEEEVGYHGKWCEQNGLFYGLLRNELRAQLRKDLANYMGIKDEPKSTKL